MTDLICNDYSSVIGFEIETDTDYEGEEGRLRKITAISVPINGGVSANQLQDYQQHDNYVEDLEFGFGFTAFVNDGEVFNKGN